MRPSTALARSRAAVREIVRGYPAANPRVFGSVLHRTDRERSDLDLLIDPLPGATLLDLGGLHAALEEALGVPVDLRTPAELPAKFRATVLAEAEPV